MNPKREPTPVTLKGTCPKCRTVVRTNTKQVGEPRPPVKGKEPPKMHFEATCPKCGTAVDVTDCGPVGKPKVEAKKQ